MLRHYYNDIRLLFSTKQKLFHLKWHHNLHYLTLSEKVPVFFTTCLLTGHEDATEDFGIYEFVSIPGKMESAQVIFLLYLSKYDITTVNKQTSAELVLLCYWPAGVMQISGSP